MPARIELEEITFVTIVTLPCADRPHKIAGASPALPLELFAEDDCFASHERIDNDPVDRRMAHPFDAEIIRSNVR
jgi:hypothetical protein